MTSGFGQFLNTCRTCTHPLARHAFEPGNLSLACQDPECECEGFLELKKGTIEVKGFYFGEPE